MREKERRQGKDSRKAGGKEERREGKVGRQISN